MINKSKQFILKIPLTPPLEKGDCMVFSYSFFIKQERFSMSRRPDKSAVSLAGKPE